MPGKRTLFNSNWNMDPQFKSWLTEDPGSVFSFTCMKCQVSRELVNLGKGALTQHMASKKHLSIDHFRLSQSDGILGNVKAQ